MWRWSVYNVASATKNLIFGCISFNLNLKATIAESYRIGKCRVCLPTLHPRRYVRVKWSDRTTSLFCSYIRRSIPVHTFSLFSMISLRQLLESKWIGLFV